MNITFRKIAVRRIVCRGEFMVNTAKCCIGTNRWSKKTLPGCGKKCLAGYCKHRWASLALKEDTSPDEKNKEATRTHKKADAQATDLPDLRPNDRVWIQHHRSKEWYKQATVLENRHNGRAYELLDDEGKTYYRGRRFLRPVHQCECVWASRSR